MYLQKLVIFNFIYKKLKLKNIHISKIKICYKHKSLKIGLILLTIKKIDDETMIFNPSVDYKLKIGEFLIILKIQEQVDKLRHLCDKIRLLIK